MTVERLASMIEQRVDWLTVRVGMPSGPDWVSCAELLAAQRANQDPTAAWRKRVQDRWDADYGAEQPPHVAAMFVLMWSVGVPAVVAAMAAALTGTAPDVAPAALAFRRHPDYDFPAEIALLSDRVVPLAEAAVTAKEHCRAFADSYQPGIKLSTLQRYGAIDDEFRGAIPVGARYAEAAGRAFGVDPASQWRTSCCFVFALPDGKECAGCPRGRRDG